MSKKNSDNKTIKIDGNVEGNVVIGDHNIISKIINNITNNNISQKTLIAFGLLIATGIAIVIIGFYEYYWKYDNTLMGSQLNIVVVPFLEQNSGRLFNSKKGMLVSQYFYSRLASDIQSGKFEQETGIRAQLRGPQEVIPIRTWFFKSPEQAVQEISEKINAHVIVYGFITYDELGRPLLSVRFYVAPERFGDAQEILGENELGSPILITGNIKSGIDLEGENHEIRNRAQVVSLLMKAIGAYIGEDFDLSIEFLEKSLVNELWKKSSGKEVIYLLAGNVRSRQALPVLLSEGEDAGLMKIKQAEQYYHLSIESASAKGEYARAYIGLSGVENFYAVYKPRLSGNWDEIDYQALSRQRIYLETALNANYQPETADIPEKVAFNQAQLLLLQYQIGMQVDIQDILRNYQYVIESFERGNVRVRELAAHSHSGIALIARIQGHYEKAVTDYLKAVKISQTPSQQAMYLYHIGNTYCDTGQDEQAVSYYQKALDMRDDLQKRVPEQQILIVESRVAAKSCQP